MRITGGTHGSRILRAPRGTQTRPTSDRVREALFSILASRDAIVGRAVLDLYAGTGALALDALSRGASHATLVDSHRASLAFIADNAAALGFIDRVRVVAQPVERVARYLCGQRFDLVFADPPYADVVSGLAIRGVEQATQGVLSEAAILVLEHGIQRGAQHATSGGESRGPAVAGFMWNETRRYGDTLVSFYERARADCAV